MIRFKINEIVKKYGIENVIVEYFTQESTPLSLGLLGDSGLAIKSTSGQVMSGLYRITERRYKVDDRYKVELEPLNDCFSYEAFYQTDFNSIINENHDNYINVFINSNGTLKNILNLK